MVWKGYEWKSEVGNALNRDSPEERAGLAQSESGFRDGGKRRRPRRDFEHQYLRGGKRNEHGWPKRVGQNSA